MFQIGTHDTLTEAERAILSDLWVAAWTRVFPQIDFAARRDWLLARLCAGEAQGGTTLVLRQAATHALVGFTHFDRRTGWLDQIAVAPDVQGTDAARKLLNAAKERCPSGISLDVNADNARALRFYAREGFVQTGTGLNPTSGLATVLLRWTA